MESVDKSISGSRSEKWSYSTYLREYLLLVARKGRIALESFNNFPDHIELSKEWHEMLDDIRNATQDGRERWSLIGVREERNAIFLPTIAAVGYENYVPSQLMVEEITKARNNFGIVDLLGDVHSHPRGLVEKVAQKLPFSGELGLGADFSVGDYYCMVFPHHFKIFMGLVDGGTNMFVFKTRQTKDLLEIPITLDQESFEEHWYEKFGYKYLGGLEKYGVHRAIPIPVLANPAGMTEAILDQYKLVLYRGKSGEDLKKVYPK